MLPTTIIRRLRQEFDVLSSQAEELDGKLTVINMQKDAIAVLLEGRDEDAEEAESQRRNGNASAKQIAEFAYEMIGTEGRPVHRDRIREEMEAKGITVREGDNNVIKLRAISSALSLDDRFVPKGHNTGLWELAVWRTENLSADERDYPVDEQLRPSAPPGRRVVLVPSKRSRLDGLTDEELGGMMRDATQQAELDRYRGK